MPFLLLLSSSFLHIHTAILYLPRGFQVSGYAVAIPAMLFATFMYIFNAHRLLDCWKVESDKNHKIAARMEEVRALLESTAPVSFPSLKDNKRITVVTTATATQQVASSSPRESNHNDNDDDHRSATTSTTTTTIYTQTIDLSRTRSSRTRPVRIICRTRHLRPCSLAFA